MPAADRRRTGRTAGLYRPVWPDRAAGAVQAARRVGRFHTLADTFTEEDLRTGIANAEYQVAFEVDQYDPETLDGWVVLVLGSAHHVDTEAERASISNAGADPWPETESEHLVLVQPTRISGRRRRF